MRPARPTDAPEPSTREPILSGRFLRVTAANFCFFMTFASFFLLPVRIRELGGTHEQVGLVMGMIGLSGLVGVFAIGVWIDRLGCRVFLRGGLAGMALVSFAFAFVDHVGLLMVVLRGAQGLAFASGFNAASTLAAAFAPRDRRATALGWFGVSTLTTHALAPSLGEQIAHLAGFPALFMIAASFSLIGLAIAWTLPDPVGSRRSAQHARGSTPPPHPKRSPLPKALRTCLATSTGCGIAFGAVITFVPTFVSEAELGPVAIFFLSYTTAAIAIRLWAGRVADDFGLRRMILPAIAGLSAAIFGLSEVHNGFELGIAGTAFGLAQGVVYPTLNAFSVDLISDADLGRVQAFYNGTFNIGVTSSALAFGPLVEAHGHRVMFMCAAGVALLALAIFAIGTAGSAVAGEAQ